MLKNELINIVSSQVRWLEPDDNEIEREALHLIPNPSPFAHILTGVRRAGKSTLMRQWMRTHGYKNYISFEDPRTFGFTGDDFFKLEEVFAEINGPGDSLFFDEIQIIPSWERYVRFAIDNKKVVFMTGSNASLLSSELGTKLTGRHLDFEVFPFTFKEYLLFRGQDRSADTFRQYLTSGGFPEYLRKDREEVLSTLFSDILTRDIFIRYSLKNAEVYRQITRFIISNIGKEVSFNGIRNNFGLGSASSVMDFFSYLRDAYLFFLVPRFDRSLKVQAVNPRKVYCVDTGLVNANSLSSSSDNGRLLENYVYLVLRRLGGEVYYFRRDRECDFIYHDKTGKYSAIQVCWRVDAYNEKRELEGLLEAMKHMALDEGRIITFDQEDRLTIGDKTVHLVPAWKLDDLEIWK